MTEPLTDLERYELYLKAMAAKKNEDITVAVPAAIVRKVRYHDCCGEVRPISKS
jgi:hypothetical protein